MSAWVPCAERLPRVQGDDPADELERVLIFTADGEWHVAFLGFAGAEMLWMDDNDLFLRPERVTHWMSLPEPPA